MAPSFSALKPPKVFLKFIQEAAVCATRRLTMLNNLHRHESSCIYVTSEADDSDADRGKH